MPTMVICNEPSADPPVGPQLRRVALGRTSLAARGCTWLHSLYVARVDFGVVVQYLSKVLVVRICQPQ